MNIRKPYAKRERFSIDFLEPSMTQQHMKTECDVNHIVAKWNKTGLLEHVRDSEGSYGDFNSVDYKTACDLVLRAEESFSSLPSSIRARFENSPALFMDFMHDPDNRDEIISMGLTKPEVVSNSVVKNKIEKESVEDTQSSDS